MTSFRAALLILLCLVSFASNAQIIQLIGTSEEFILENVKGYNSVEEKGLEYEEFNVLVFEDKNRELAFYFTFYRGDKICNYIKSTAPLSALKEEIQHIKSNFKNIRDNVWENSSGKTQAVIRASNGLGVIMLKELR